MCISDDVKHIPYQSGRAATACWSGMIWEGDEDGGPRNPLVPTANMTGVWLTQCKTQLYKHFCDSDLISKQYGSSPGHLEMAAKFVGTLRFLWSLAELGAQLGFYSQPSMCYQHTSKLGADICRYKTCTYISGTLFSYLSLCDWSQ